VRLSFPRSRISLPYRRLASGCVRSAIRICRQIATAFPFGLYSTNNVSDRRVEVFVSLHYGRRTTYSPEMRLAWLSSTYSWLPDRKRFRSGFHISDPVLGHLKSRRQLLQATHTCQSSPSLGRRAIPWSLSALPALPLSRREKRLVDWRFQDSYRSFPSQARFRALNKAYIHQRLHEIKPQSTSLDSFAICFEIRPSDKLPRRRPRLQSASLTSKYHQFPAADNALKYPTAASSTSDRQIRVRLG